MIHNGRAVSPARKITVTDHEPAPVLEEQPEYEGVELTEVDMVGPGAAFDGATGLPRDEKDIERIRLRVRKQPEPEPEPEPAKGKR